MNRENECLSDVGEGFRSGVERYLTASGRQWLWIRLTRTTGGSSVGVRALEDAGTRIRNVNKSMSERDRLNVKLEVGDGHAK